MIGPEVGPHRPDNGPAPAARAQAPDVVICAPGAGLGHLVRSASLALRLSERGVAARILTNSPFAPGLARLTGCDIEHVPDRRWKDELPDRVARLRPQLVLLDSFPFGLRGEWANQKIAGPGFVYIARRLQVRRYLESIGPGRGPAAPRLASVIAAEPLGADHEEWLAETGAEVFRLPGRIRLPEYLPAPPVPDRLEELLDTGRLWLIVHSGPGRELKALLARAQSEMARTGDRGPVAAVSARPAKGMGAECFEYFPAARLFARAFRVVGGAGYNLAAETEKYRDKRLLVPFPRKFDDQQARAGGPAAPDRDGGPAAADRLASMLAGPR